MSLATVVDLGLGNVRLSVRDLSPALSFGIRYGEPQGEGELREAIAALEGSGVDEVIVTTGASMGLTALLATFDRPCSVLCPRPYYPGYRSTMALLGIEPIFYDLKEDLNWTPDPEAMRPLIRTDTRALLLNLPGNPAGNLAESDVLNHLARLAEMAGLLVISDEVYADFVYSEHFPNMRNVFGRNRTVRLRSFSKSFGIPGERLGYVVGSSDLVRRISTAHWTLTMSPPATPQMIALSLLKGHPEQRVRELRTELVRIRDQVAKIMVGGKGFRTSAPHGGIFFWIESLCSSIDSRTLAQRCAAEAGVIVVPGCDFGMDGRVFLRASFAVPQAEAERGFAALAAFLEERALSK